MSSQKSGSSGSRPVPESEHKKAGSKTPASRERTQIPEDHLFRRTVVTTGFPRSGLVQWRLCPAQNRRHAFATLPLQTALGGVTVTISPPNGGPQLAYPVYAASTQINAILPSAVPVGPSNFTVTYNGAASQSTPIQVVSSAFGIFTANFGSRGRR